MTPRLPLVLLALLLTATDAHATFSDATGAAGLFGDSQSWGAQAIDIDGDDVVDLMLGHHALSVNLFTNDGTATFSTGGIPQIITAGEDRHGLLWSDLDGDGALDVVSSHGGGGGCGCPSGGNELWRSLGSGNFLEIGGAGGMLDAAGRGRSFSAADIDGDGDLDLHHAKAPLGASPNSLYRNDGAMTFTDVSIAWNLDEGEGTVGGLFADYDNDGDPDLLVGGEEFGRSTVLWRNDGGTFNDATADAFGGALPVIAGADFGDYDNDGDLDLVICEGNDAIYDAWGVDGNDYWFFANHRLADDGVDAFTFETPGGTPVAILEWRGTFTASRIFLGPSGVHPGGPVIVLTDAYVGAPTFTPGVDEGLYLWRDFAGGPWQVRVSAPPATFGNYSGTVFTSSGVANASDSGLEQLSVPAASPRVFRNDGGAFTETTLALGLTPSGNPRGVSWVDFDNDGDLDLHLVNKGTAETRGEANVLWRNDGATFTALTGAGWVDGDTDHLSDGATWADFDGNGTLDLVVQDGTGPAFYNSLAGPRFYRNDGPAGNWLAVSLGQTATGGTPVGARVTTYAAGDAVHRRVSANSWRGFQRPLALHFGLGADTVVDSVVVDWPGGGHQVVRTVSANAHIHLDESAGATAAPTPGRPSFLVGRVTPQPAFGVQRVELQLAAPAQVHVAVYDVTGRRVRTLLRGRQPAGALRIEWDGRDSDGRPVPAGIYFLRGSGDVEFQSKAVRLR